MLSALTGRKVRRDVAMTGEVTLRGRVLPIGGLKEKTMAAKRYGIHTVLIPKDNARDLEEIDQILNDYSRGWKTTRMSRVDLTALRLAVYEMKFDEDVPVGVAINEAVELAKMFGGEDSGSFVNGILGKIASGKKETGEAPKKRRPAHQAKIIIRSSKKASGESETEESSN